jgi:hypothetical protein
VLESGDRVIVSIGPVHATARVVEVAGSDVYLDCNILGGHRQIERPVEDVVEITKPSDCLPHGLCACCEGWGVVDNAIRGPSACGVCGGVGRMGVELTVVTDGRRVQGVTWLLEPDGWQAGLTCQLCGPAFTR